MAFHTVSTEAKAKELVAMIRDEGMRACWLKLCDGRYEVREWF